MDEEEDRKIGGRGGRRVFNENDKGGDNDTNDGGKKFGKFQVQCFYCKRFGHSQSNCWKKQNQQDEFSEEKGYVDTFLLPCDSTNKVSKEL